MDLQQLLGTLHSKTAELLLGRIDSGEASAAEIAQAIALLKHNNITATRDDDAALTELRNRLQTRRKRGLRVVGGQDLADLEE